MIRVKIFDPGFPNFFHHKSKILLNQHMLEVSTWKVIKNLKNFAHLQKMAKDFHKGGLILAPPQGTKG